MSPLFSAFKRRAYPLYRKYFTKAYLYEGELDGDGTSATCLFVDNDRFYQQILQKLYVGSPKLIRSFRCWTSGVTPQISTRGFYADICIANVAHGHAEQFRKNATFCFQTRVTQTLDIGVGLEANKRFQDSHKRISRKIRTHGLSYRVSTSSDDFDYFYRRMYLPLITKFGVAALGDSYDDLQQIFEKGFLLSVLHNGEPVAGLISFKQNGTLLTFRLGLLDGNSDYLEMGAQSACYLFLVEHARQQGISKIDFMRSLPLLNDGVYLHKRLLGAAAEPFDEATTCVCLFKRCGSELFARIMKNLPLIVQTESGLEGVVWFPEDKELTPALQRELTKQYGAPGVAGLILLRSDGTMEHLPFQENEYPL